QPVPGYTVSANRVDRQKRFPSDTDDSATTDEEGKYELELWAPGDYHLLLRTAAGAPAPNAKTVHLEPGEDETADFVLSGAPLKGKVVDESGTPVPHAKLLAVLHLPSSEGNLTVATAQDGGFEVETDAATGAHLMAMKP